MTLEPMRSPYSRLRLLARKDVLAGLMFMAIAAFGLFVSRNYPIGTTLRMGTGYVPRLLLWVLAGLGFAVLVQGLREKGAAQQREHGEPAPSARHAASTQLLPLIVVATSLIAFALSIESLGLVLSIILLVGIGALAARGIKLWETAAAALGLIVISWAIFIVGMGLTIPVWPDW
jgi:hypothetical protein